MSIVDQVDAVVLRSHMVTVEGALRGELDQI